MFPSPRRTTAFLTLLLALAALPAPAAAQGTPLACQTSYDTFGNACASVSYAWLDISGAAVALNAGDDVTTLVDLPFPVSHYGLARTQAVVSTNGFLSFDTTASAACCSPQVLPDPTFPNDLVVFWWTDLVVPEGGLRMATLGAAPERIVVLEYADVTYFGETVSLSFQVQIHESGAIEIHYASMPNPTGRDVGVGLEDCNGHVGLPAALGPFEAFQSALRFTPGNGTACVPAPVNHPPQVTIDAPAYGETVSGVIVVSGTATDPDAGDAVDLVQVSFSDVPCGVDGTDSWSCWIDTTAFPDAEHVISATASDGETSSTAYSVVRVQNGNAPNVPPQAFLTSPADGSVVTGNVVIEGYAQDPDGGVVQAIDIGLSGPSGGIAFQTTDNPFSFDMGAQSASGNYVVTAAAFDGEAWGEPTYSWFYYDAFPGNEPPSLTIVSPAEGETLPPQFTVSGIATDADGDNLDVTVCLEYAPYPCSVVGPDAGGSWAVGIDASGLAEGPYTIRVVADDHVEAATASVNVYIDTVHNSPPGVGITTPAAGAFVSGFFEVGGFATDSEQSDGSVEVCFGGDFGATCQQTFVSFQGPQWNVLVDATPYPEGSYYVSAQAWDGYDWSPAVIVHIFVGADGGARPVASILSPPDGSVLAGMSTIELSAWDPDGEPVAQMELCVVSAPPGMPMGCDYTELSYVHEPLDTTQLPDGSYTLSLRARDAVGYGDFAYSTFTIANGGGNQPPVVTIGSPADGAVVHGVVDITGSATDVDGWISEVGLLVNGAWRGTSPVVGGAWQFQLDTSSIMEGTYSIEVFGTDDGGLTGSASILVVVERPNTAPYVAIHHPTHGATVSGVFEAFGSAFDNEGDPLQVEVRIDGGAWLPAERGWARLFDARGLAPGLHDLEARAFDGELYSAVGFAQFQVEDAGALEVHFESPAPDAIVSGVATFAGTALEPDAGAAFEYVQVRVDHGPWLLATGTTSWTRDVDTTTLADGRHEAWARAWDGSAWVFGATTFFVENRADLSVSDEDVVVERAPVRTDAGDAPLASSPERTVRVTVHNAGTAAAAPGAIVRLYADGELVGEATLRAVAAGGSESVKIAWDTLGWVGDVDLMVEIEPAGDDADWTNHQAHARDFVGVGGLGGARIAAL